jgi:predicted ATP-grasp superfamily ATP-dependent carboligase
MSPHSGPLDALVLDAHMRGSLAVARSLGARGRSLALASQYPDAPGLRSRYASVRASLPLPDVDIGRYGDAVVDILSATPCDVVMTSSDEGVTGLAFSRQRIERLAFVALPPPEALSVATSKERTLAVARELGIPVPRSVNIQDPSDITAAADDVGYPCVLKPDVSWRLLDGGSGEGITAAYLPDREAASAAAARLLGQGSGGLVQEYAEGRREAISVVRHRDGFSAHFAMGASRTWPPLGGNSVMRESIEAPPDALEYSRRLLDATGYEGYAEVEFRRSRQGRPLLMEINPRFSASVELALRAGVDLAAMHFDWANGTRPQGPVEYRVGVRLSWLEGEFRLLAARLIRAPEPCPRLRETLRAIARDYRRPPRIDAVDLHDPLPTLFALRRSVGGAVSTVARRP